MNFCNTGVLFYERQIVTIHDMSYKVNPKWFSKGFYLWYNFLIPLIAANALKIFTVSNSSKNDIISFLKLNPEKISVIYNSSYLNTNDNFDNNNTGKYLLSVSAINPRKNLNNLIRAFSEINHNVKLIIVGLESRHFGPALENTLINNNNIVIKGYVEDKELASLMKNAEAFLYLSHYEGFGLPPLEAMSLNCPVIVSDITAHREVCGNAALYVNPNNIQEIKETIIKLLFNDKLKTDLIIAGEINKKKFDWFDSAKTVLKNINEIVTKYK